MLGAPRKNWITSELTYIRTLYDKHLSHYLTKGYLLQMSDAEKSQRRKTVIT